MFRREDLGKQVRLDSDFVAGLDADEVGRDAIAVEFRPGADNVPHGFQQVFRGQDRPGGHAAEVALGQIVRDSGRVVHMPVREQDVVDRNDLVRGLTDVESNVQLRYGHHGLFTGNGITDDIQIVDGYLC